MIAKITFVSHILAAFRLVPLSCTSSTLLRRKTQTDSSSATLPLTIIVEPALSWSVISMSVDFEFAELYDFEVADVGAVDNEAY